MNPQDRRARLAARNAAMRRQVEALLDGLTRQTAALHTAQAQAAAVTGTATSADGLVTATVNAAGIITEVRFAPPVFSRSSPDTLARSVVAATQQAAADAHRQVEAALVPVRGNLPDLPDVFPGAPSLTDLARTDLRAHRPAKQARHDEEVDDEDFSTHSVLRGGRR